MKQKAKGLCLVMSALMMLFLGQAEVEALSLGEAADFAILGLEGGTVTINSATSIIGNVGYSKGVTSTTNQKVDFFDGTVYVHSLADFSYTAATFNPTGGFVEGGDADAKLDAANTDAVAASDAFAALPSTHNLGSLVDNEDLIIKSVGLWNVISLDSLTYKEDTLELQSRPGFDDFFIFNVAGDFEFAASEIKLTDVSAEHVLFNFFNGSSISFPQVNIYKADSAFRGTILGPHADVDYHNPATFEGAIIAKSFTLHSDFNITHSPFSVPDASIMYLLGTALIFLAVVGRKRKRANGAS